MRVIDRYLAQLVKSQLEGNKASDLPTGVTVEEIVDIAKKSRMECILLSALINVDNVSDEEKQAIKPLILRCMTKTSVQIQEMKRLESEFEKEGIKNQPMKGAILRFVYPSPELREMSDLDILVSESDFSRGVNVLEKCGYTLLKTVKHHSIYIKKPFMAVEVHYAMYDKTVDKKQDKYFQGFDKATIKEGYNYTYEFGLEDFYIYMIAHMAKHFYQTGCGIRHLVDIYVYLNAYERQMSREYIDAELEQCGILTFAKHMEKLAFSWLDGKEETKLYSDIFLYMLDSGIYGKEENGIWNMLAEDTNKNMSRKQLRKWYFFPPLYYMSKYYPFLETKKWLLPWAWLVRGVKAIFGEKGGDRRTMIEAVDMEKVDVLKEIYKAVDLKFFP